MNIASKQLAGNTTVGDISDPRSMFTLGASASMVVMLTTAFAEPFKFPAIYVALALSFFFAWGQVFLMSTIERFASRIFFTVITAMLIFATARGGNATAVQIEQSVTPVPVAEQVTNLLDFIVPDARGIADGRDCFGVIGKTGAEGVDGISCIAGPDLSEWQQPTNSVPKPPIFKPW